MREWLASEGLTIGFMRRYLMFYPHKPGVVFSLLGSRIVFPFARLGFALTNLLSGGMGNKIVVVGERGGEKRISNTSTSLSAGID